MTGVMQSEAERAGYVPQVKKPTKRAITSTYQGGAGMESTTKKLENLTYEDLLDRLLLGIKVTLYEHPRDRNRVEKYNSFATAHLTAQAVVYEEGEPIYLCGDTCLLRINVYRTSWVKPIAYTLTVGDPNLYDKPYLVEKVKELAEWAETLCKALNNPPDPWPIGD